MHPDQWGRGLASGAVDVAVQAMAGRGTTEAELWCLAENRRARRLYEHLGWTATADQRPAPWPPHPVELRYVRALARRLRCDVTATVAGESTLGGPPCAHRAGH